MPNAMHLTSEELLALRKPVETISPPNVGEKFYHVSKDNMQNEMVVKCALDDHQEVLEQKKAARMCDLMQAQWNDSSSIAVAKKLKGKFTQHIGHPIHGTSEIALSPEEAVFMLENGNLEVLNGKIPMSTEEAYSVMLKGKNGIEKYQVYAHLSRLGFLVVNHQLKLGVTQYEKQMNLDKHKIKTKKKITILNEGETTQKKSLDFSGCIPTSIISNSDPSLEKTSYKAIPSEIRAVESSQNQNENSNKSSENCDLQMDVDEEDILAQSNDVSIERSFKPSREQSLEPILEQSLEASKKQILEPSSNEQILEPSSNKQILEPSSNEQILAPLKEQNLGPSQEKSLVSSREQSIETTKEQSLRTSKEQNLRPSQEQSLESCKEQSLEPSKEPSLESSKVSGLEPSKEPSLEPSMEKSLEPSMEKSLESSMEKCLEPSKEQSLELSKDQSLESSNEQSLESSKEQSSYVVSKQSSSDNAFCEMISSSSNNMGEISVLPGIIGDEANQAVCHTENSDVLEESQDSECDESSMNSKSKNEIDLSSDKDNSYDVMCCDTKSQQSDDSIASVNLVEPKKKSPLKELQVDDGIFFVEVKKKQSKPMAVIDLSSDEELGSSERGSDDDIQVIKVCEPAKGKKRRKKAFLKQIKGKFLDYKREAPRPRIISARNVFPFPDLKGRDFICLPHPPARFLPANVKPAKEAYPIDLKTFTGIRLQRTDAQPQTHNRVWNSYKDLEERARQNRSQRFPEYGTPFAQDRRFPYNRSSQSYNSVVGNNSILPFPNIENQPNRRGFGILPSITPHNYFPPLINNQGNNFNNSPYKNNAVQPSVNSNLLNLSDRVVQEVQRTAYFVTRNVLSSYLGPASVPESLLSAQVEQNVYNLVENGVQNSVFSVPHESRISPRGQFSGSSVISKGPVNYPGYKSSPLSDPWVSGNASFNQSRDNSDHWPSGRHHRPFESRRRFRREYRRFRNRDEFKRNVYPTAFQRRNHSQSWKDYRPPEETSVVVDDDDEGEEDEIEEVPFDDKVDLRKVLWSKEICPLVKDDPERPVVDDVYSCLRITKVARLSEKINIFEKYLPTTCSFEITFDVYLPGTSYRKSCPSIPNHRIVVLRSTDNPTPSDVLFLQRQFCDGAFLQFAVVDNGDISFYSYNNINRSR